MIDWTKPLTLCWCGFEFHSTNYRQPYLRTLAETIDKLHLKTHRTEARTVELNRHRERIEEFLQSLPPIEYGPDIIAGDKDKNRWN